MPEAADPERAEREGAPVRLMELINGAHLQRLPGGVVGRAENGLAAFVFPAFPTVARLLQFTLQRARAMLL
jgi:hypothetical protein